MKKDKVSIKSILINHILKFIYDVCVNFLEGALLANALYTNQDLIETDLTNSFPKNVPFPFCQLFY